MNRNAIFSPISIESPVSAERTCPEKSSSSSAGEAPKALSDYIFCIRHKPLKRCFDIAFSCIILIFGFPIFLLIAMAVKITSSGPIFFAHMRVGRAGKLFKCYKFRTMHSDADAMHQQIVAADPKLRQEWELVRKLKCDPRITSFGMFLRKTSLDELPQFWNVLKGDLSVVGPRPVVLDEVNKYFGSRTGKILSVRPGITGLWQVSGRSRVAYPLRLQIDEQYIDKWSMLLDRKLIAKTIPSMIFCRDAY